jgi:hypothetical protein
MKLFVSAVKIGTKRGGSKVGQVFNLSAGDTANPNNRLDTCPTRRPLQIDNELADRLETCPTIQGAKLASGHPPLKRLKSY